MIASASLFDLQHPMFPLHKSTAKKRLPNTRWFQRECEALEPAVVGLNIIHPSDLGYLSFLTRTGEAFEKRDMKSRPEKEEKHRGLPKKEKE